MQAPAQILFTPRLKLRPFLPEDASEVERLAGAREIADTTTSIPHPYPPGEAKEWISRCAVQARQGTCYTFAIVRQEEEALVGAIELDIMVAHNRAEMGYWIGLPYWGLGYATEAAQRLVAFGFEELGLNRIQAFHFTRNPASRRVQEKAGLTYEGILRQYLRKGDRFEDCGICSILREVYFQKRIG